MGEVGHIFFPLLMDGDVLECMQSEVVCKKGRIFCMVRGTCATVAVQL